MIEDNPVLAVLLSLLLTALLGWFIADQKMKEKDEIWYKQYKSDREDDEDDEEMSAEDKRRMRLQHQADLEMERIRRDQEWEKAKQEYDRNSTEFASSRYRPSTSKVPTPQKRQFPEGIYPYRFSQKQSIGYPSSNINPSILSSIIQQDTQCTNLSSFLITPEEMTINLKPFFPISRYFLGKRQERHEERLRKEARRMMEYKMLEECVSQVFYWIQSTQQVMLSQAIQPTQIYQSQKTFSNPVFEERQNMIDNTELPTSPQNSSIELIQKNQQPNPLVESSNQIYKPVEQPQQNWQPNIPIHGQELQLAVENKGTTSTLPSTLPSIPEVSESQTEQSESQGSLSVNNKSQCHLRVNEPESKPYIKLEEVSPSQNPLNVSEDIPKTNNIQRSPLKAPVIEFLPPKPCVKTDKAIVAPVSSVTIQAASPGCSSSFSPLQTILPPSFNVKIDPRATIVPAFGRLDTSAPRTSTKNRFDYEVPSLPSEPEPEFKMPKGGFSCAFGSLRI